LRVLPLSRFPALSRLPGHIPAKAGKVSGTGEAPHIGANFRQDHFRQASFDAGYRLQSLQLRFIRAQPLGNVSAQTLDLFIKRVNVR